MKIQIDTDQKTIKLEASVSLNELFIKLDKLFPNEEWKEYKLETHTIINNWQHPIVIRDYNYPWRNPFYHGTGTITNNCQVNSIQQKTLYNLEV